MCSKCSCGKHTKNCRNTSLKLKYKGNQATIYQKDFISHPLGAQATQIKNDFFTTFYNSETMSINSTMKVIISILSHILFHLLLYRPISKIGTWVHPKKPKTHLYFKQCLLLGNLHIRYKYDLFITLNT